MSGRGRSRDHDSRNGNDRDRDRRERPAIPERPPATGSQQQQQQRRQQPPPSVAVTYPSLDGPPQPPSQARPPPSQAGPNHQRSQHQRNNHNRDRPPAPYYPPVDYPHPPPNSSSASSSSSSSRYYPHGYHPDSAYHPAHPPPRDYWPDARGPHPLPAPPHGPYQGAVTRHSGPPQSLPPPHDYRDDDYYGRPHSFYDRHSAPPQPPPLHFNAPPYMSSRASPPLPPSHGPGPSRSRRRPDSPSAPPRSSERNRDRSDRRDNRERDGNRKRRDRSPRPSVHNNNNRRADGRESGGQRSQSPDAVRRRREISRTPLSPSDDHTSDDEMFRPSSNHDSRRRTSQKNQHDVPSVTMTNEDDVRKRPRSEDASRKEVDKRRRLSNEEAAPMQVEGLQANRDKKLAFGLKSASIPHQQSQVKKGAQSTRRLLDDDDDEDDSEEHQEAKSSRSRTKERGIPEQFKVVYPTLDTPPPSASLPAREPLIPKAVSAIEPPSEDKRQTAIRPVVPAAEHAIPAAVAVPSPSSPKTAIPKAKPAINELYERLVQVGEGTYGKVYKARNVETGAIVGLKKIRMEAEKDGFPVTSIREIKLLQSVRHSNVIGLIEMMVSRGSVYMVFEYMEHDLTGVLNHPSIVFTQAHLKSLMQQFLEGLGFVHQRGILHRDLKGSNILLSRTGELKIADFGLARFFAKNRSNDYTNRVITQWYKPPELLFGATVYGPEVDMWSAGCIFLELFTRRPVFQGHDEIHQLDVIFDVLGTPSVDDWPNVRDLPWYDLVKPKEAKPSVLRRLFSTVSSSHHPSSSSFSSSNATTTTNGSTTKAHTYELSQATLELAERLLSLDPSKRVNASEALSMAYFVSEDPPPLVPADILANVKGEWHEYESKKARRKMQKEVVSNSASAASMNANAKEKGVNQ